MSDEASSHALSGACATHGLIATGNIALAQFFLIFPLDFRARKRETACSLYKCQQKHRENSEEAGHVDIRDLKLHHGFANKTVT